MRSILQSGPNLGSGSESWPDAASPVKYKGNISERFSSLDVGVDHTLSRG